MTPNIYSFQRYLAAKRTIDDRALNQHVWRTFVRAAGELFSRAEPRLLEVGAGIGTMIERMLDWDFFESAADASDAERGNRAFVAAYLTAIDDQPENVRETLRRLSSFAERETVTLREGPDRLRLRRSCLVLDLDLEAIDLFDFVARERGRRRWNVLLALALLDLLPMPEALRSLFSLLDRGGLFYFGITFDGETILEPEIDRALDGQIAALYHQTADDRRLSGRRSGDSRAGRHLFHQLRSAGAQVLDMGGSDWVVFPGPAGYSGDDAYFLHFIIRTIEQALGAQTRIAPRVLQDWLHERHAQIERGELIYIAHQLDVVGRVL